ncbi:hypothetical protein [Lactiplantibacillus xiangfangensis]|uniref:Uncharacterized protein n=1 Tax=Lactiplantibacillus xiangfangensis TaxID=942150 RepID=A0A0R2M073_9LACO|nr:hypothetical protein [Lactiplantibacillus xiangfangensis]KRO07397.1 hypothetical protein IV64_GL001316 [Lactiplantibacillus xiangfangensis]
MKKHVAGTIIKNDSHGTSFLVGRNAQGKYYFYYLDVLEQQTPLASVLWELRHTIGIDVDQLRLYDSIIAEVGGEKVSVFVFDHLAIDERVQALFEKRGLAFVPANQLHSLFESVNVGQTSPLEDFSK